MRERADHEREAAIWIFERRFAWARRRPEFPCASGHARCSRRYFVRPCACAERRQEFPSCENECTMRPCAFSSGRTSARRVVRLCGPSQSGFPCAGMRARCSGKVFRASHRVGDAAVRIFLRQNACVRRAKELPTVRLPARCGCCDFRCLRRHARCVRTKLIASERVRIEATRSSCFEASYEFALCANTWGRRGFSSC